MAQEKRSLPEHLTELAAQSTAGLDQGECEKVERLLVEYQDVFSTGEFDIGRTTLVKYSIDTGDAAPIRQPLRRSSSQQREEVERQVQELLSKGLIQERKGWLPTVAGRSLSQRGIIVCGVCLALRTPSRIFGYITPG